MLFRPLLMDLEVRATPVGVQLVDPVNPPTIYIAPSPPTPEQVANAEYIAGIMAALQGLENEFPPAPVPPPPWVTFGVDGLPLNPIQVIDIDYGDN